MKKKKKPTVRIEVRGSVVQDWTGTDAESFTFLNKLKRQQNRFVKQNKIDWPLCVTIHHLMEQRKRTEAVPETKVEEFVFVPDW